jgi:lipopolysaccharide transport system permease protein
MSTTDQLRTSLHPDPTADSGPDPEDDPGPGSIETVIRPRSGWIAVDWAEMVRGRELLYHFIWRDVKVRYKQTVLGVAWAVLQPLFTMAVFTLIFGRFAKIETATPEVPYPVFVFVGLIFWTYFSGGVAGAGMSLINQQHLMTKVYFPRLFVPMACVGTVLVDLAISLVVFGFLMIYYGVAPSWQSPLLVPLIGLMTLASIGLGCLFASLTVVYRDFRYIVGFAMQIMMFLSPVIYPLDLLPKAYHPILSLNPMFGLIDGSRSAVLGTPWHLPSLAISSASSLALFVFGLSYFRRTERRFADLV